MPAKRNIIAHEAKFNRIIQGSIFDNRNFFSLYKTHFAYSLSERTFSPYPADVYTFTCFNITES